MSKDPAKTTEYIKSGLTLACDQEPASSHEPYYELYSHGDDKLHFTKICHEHREVVSTTVEINPFWTVHIRGLEFGIKCMERDT